MFVLEFVEANRFDRAMAKGRTSPLLLAGERRDGSEVELVAKFSAGNGLGVDGLAREAIGAMLAIDLDLATPEPYLVRIGVEFVKQVITTSATSGALLKNSVPVGFGSRRLPNGYVAWMPGQTATKG